MTPQQYVQIKGAASALREARLTQEIARLQVVQADNNFAAILRAAGLDPTQRHRFDDETLSIETEATAADAT